MSEGYTETDIAILDNYLADAPIDIPIFILAHFPIHLWGDKLSENADKLAETLNKYPNVIFVWGHNHSAFDEYYDKVFRAGDVLVIDGNGTEVELNFTYLSAGCISDAEYTGVSGGSAWVLGKGLIVTISANGEVSFDYYTMDANVMKEKGPYFVKYRDGIKYSTLKTEYIADGGAGVLPEVSDAINYKFVGWDGDISEISCHSVITAKYEYITNLDPDYVYFTIQEGEGLAVGKSGTPILQYAVPYTPNMNVMDALKILHDAEFESGGIEITVGEHGAINGVWGHSTENGTWVMDPANGRGNIYSSEKLIGGRSYYVYALEGDELKDTSYLSPFVNNVVVGEKLTMKAEAWRYQTTTYGYVLSELNGDVYVGETLDSLTETGIDAINGIFDIQFDIAGTYYIAVKSDIAGLAVSKVVVGNSNIDL